MARGKKITKKQLKEPDEFITFTEQGLLFLKSHAKAFSLGGLVVVAVLLAIFLYRMWEQKKEQEAYLKFYRAQESYQMARSPYREGSPAEYRTALDQLNEVIKEYPGTTSGRFALLYRGNIQLRMGQWEESVKSYQAYLEKPGAEKLYQFFAWEGLGYAYEGKKDYAKAMEAFQRAAALGEQYKLGEAYLGMGRCYERMGKEKEAVESYKKFLAMSPQSQMANMILRKVSLLER